MNSKILLLALTVAAFSSCTTAYKTGQTPDDVYFSPARPQDEYVRIDKEDKRQYRSDDDYYDDRYLRMKVSNRSRWNDFNDWYSYEKYGFGYNYTYGTYYNPYNSWNYYYNPYCTNTVIINSKTTSTYNKPRTYNLNTYNSTAGSSTTQNNMFKYVGAANNSTSNTYTAPRNSSTRSSNSNSGNVLRDIFGGGNNNTGSPGSNSSGKSNTSSSSSSSSGSSSSSSGSSAPVRRF